MAEKVTHMRLKVDLQCSKCTKKVKEVLCEFPVQGQWLDDKNNIVTIAVVCCRPEKIRDEICRKGGRAIKSIKIVEHPKKPDAGDKKIVAHKPKGGGEGDKKIVAHKPKGGEGDKKIVAHKPRGGGEGDKKIVAHKPRGGREGDKKIVAHKPRGGGEGDKKIVAHKPRGGREGDKKIVAHKPRGGGEGDKKKVARDRGPILLQPPPVMIVIPNININIKKVCIFN